MRRTEYTKYKGDMASEIDMEDLLDALSDYMLDSGFRDPYADFPDLEHTMDDLREALRRAIENGDFFDEDLRQKLDQLKAEGKLDELVEKLIERMERENYISARGPRGPKREGNGQGRGQEGEARFEVTATIRGIGPQELRPTERRGATSLATR